MSPRPALHLAVALDGAGWHPAAWRAIDARPSELASPGYWRDLVIEAEFGLLDLVTIEDGFALQSSDPTRPDDRTDAVRGRLDAVLVAARVAPLTRRIGLVATVVATHTEPFHVSKAIATLDHVSAGRAGVRVRVSARADEAALFGRRTIPAVDLLDEAADHVEVLRRLWDSWEDDAEIRDATTGRFIDRDKLHYIDFSGRWFAVSGPSITPRPPQGQPIVTVLADGELPLRLGARSADIVHVTPRDAADAADLVARIRREADLADRAGDIVHVFADLAVFLDTTTAAAKDRKEALDALAGAQFTGDDASLFVGTAPDLADLMLEWQTAGVTGFRLRPGSLPADLHAISRSLVPELQARGAFRTAYEAATLRGLLGLPRPANRYARA
jgi:alkanesulfonate monooxygenase SsuD/methylene tetrahydromethanopterin reductase-like flavin-dependent oxidoreductase (luciferase family)